MTRPEPMVPTRTTANQSSPAARSRRLSRREVVGGAVAGLGMAAVAEGGARALAAAWPLAAPGEFLTGAPYAAPRELRSADGRLDVALSARLGPATMGGQTVTTYSYDGIVPGPTLRLGAGDTLNVALTNVLPQVTNFHTHGLHVSPQGNSDNVFLHIEPGERADLQFDIPRDGTSGLYIPGFYWYHPHVHGNTALQTGSGMAGAIIVEGPLDTLPGIAGLPERLMILRGAFFDAEGAATLPHGDDEPVLFVNDQVAPVLAIAPGETQRWRLLNASIFTFMHVALDGHHLHQISADGNPLREVWKQDAIVLAPGERAEVLVQGGAAGSYTLRSLPWGQDLAFQAQPEYILATVTCTGEPVTPAALPTTLFPFDDLRQATIDRRREVVFAETLRPFKLYINGRQFDHDRVDQTVELGATEEWVLWNTSPDTHPFHIHVNDFQVVERDGEPVDAHSWEDTITLPAFSQTVIRTRFLDFPGKFVYHCHILDHEDLGMMGVVEVVPS